MKQAKAHRLLPKKRKTELVSLVFAGVAVFFYFGVAADNAFQIQAYGTETTSAQTHIRLEPQQVALIEAAGKRGNHNAGPTPARPDAHASTSTSNAPLALEAKSTSASDRVNTRAEAKSNTKSVKSANLGKTWSVQLAAAPTKAVADKMTNS